MCDGHVIYLKGESPEQESCNNYIDVIDHNLSHVDYLLTDGTWYSHQVCTVEGCNVSDDVVENNLTTVYFSPISAFDSANTYAAITNHEVETTGTKFVKMGVEANGLLKAIVPSSYQTVVFISMNEGDEPSWDTLKVQTVDLNISDANDTKKYIVDTKDADGKYQGAWIRTNEVAIYFEDNWSWHSYGDKKVNAYFWGSTMGTNPGWPGNNLTITVTPNGDGYYRYRVVVPQDITGLIFNGNGQYGAEQSADYKEKVSDYDCFYMTYDSKTNTKPLGKYTYEI